MAQANKANLPPLSAELNQTSQPTQSVPASYAVARKDSMRKRTRSRTLERSPLDTPAAMPSGSAFILNLHPAPRAMKQLYVAGIEIEDLHGHAGV